MTYVFIHAIGFSELMARILAAAGSMDYLLFSFLAYFVIEQFGRRRVMMTSAAACSICWTIIAISLGLSENGQGDPYKLGIVAISFFFVFFASFAFWAEGASLAMASNWIMNYMVAQITPPGKPPCFLKPHRPHPL
jgi:MFS family permease